MVLRERDRSSSSDSIGAPTEKRSRLGRRDAIVAQAAGLPALLLVIAFALVPLLVVGWSSLHDVTFGNLVMGDPQYVGLQNYSRIWTDEAFRHAVLITFVFAFSVVAGSYSVGLLAAAILDRTGRAKALLFAVLLLPWAVPAVPSGLIFRWMLDGTYGVLNHGLVWIGIIDAPVQWFIDATLSLVAVTAATIWSLYPIAFIMMFAGLQTVETELYEAARVDGATVWDEFKYVSLPALRPVSVVIVLLLTLYSFRSVTLVFVMSGGGPARSTENLALFTFTEAFSFNRLATASASGVVTLILIAVITVMYLFIARRRSMLT